MSPMSPMPGLSPGGISSPSTFLQREDESRNVLIIDGSHLIKGPKREKLPVFDVQNGMEKLIREIEVYVPSICVLSCFALAVWKYYIM